MPACGAPACSSGKCFDGKGAPAFWPWLQAIRRYTHDREPNELHDVMGPGAADIAQLDSEIRQRLPAMPTPPTLEPEQARFRLFDSITTFLRNAALSRPVLLILDDLQWADEPSLRLLQFLAQEIRDAHLLVVGTYRDVALGRGHPLARTLAEVGREDLGHQIRLEGLSTEDVGRYIELTSGVSPPENPRPADLEQDGRQSLLCERDDSAIDHRRSPGETGGAR